MNRTRRSHLSTPGLLRRQFLAAPVASIVLALLVLVGALLATAVPRAVAALHTDALAERLARVPGAELDLAHRDPRRSPTPARRATAPPSPMASTPSGARQEERLLDIRDDMPEPLRGVTGAPLTALFIGPLRARCAGSRPGALPSTG